ncbi:MAG: sigma-54-dependent Fis family transcriptional regulator, partial [Deltaproteobacteria bacterium]|nr:sigma-54-dependent Fis family transcriptional regulator [Deltaproteobacteria bacterium]
GHRYQKEVPIPDGSQMQALLGYAWPGNVRELRNLAERYVLIGDQFGFSLEKLLSGQDKDQPQSLPQQVECFERSLIEQALAGANGSIKEVMATLAIPRKTLYDKMQKHGLDKSDYK